MEAALAGIRAACVDEGRDPATLGVTVGVNIAPRSPGLPAQVRAPEYPALAGTPAQIATGLRSYEALGVDHVICNLNPHYSQAQRLLAAALSLYRAGGADDPAFPPHRAAADPAASPRHRLPTPDTSRSAPPMSWTIDEARVRPFLATADRRDSDVEPGGGATVVAAGSHRRAARVLAAHPAGLTHRELFDAVLAEPIGNITELTGAAGDVVLRPPAPVPRPWLQAPRAAALHLDTEAGLRAPLRLDRLDDADHSVLEHSLRATLAGPPPVFANPVRCRF